MQVFTSHLRLTENGMKKPITIVRANQMLSSCIIHTPSLLLHWRKPWRRQFPVQRAALIGRRAAGRHFCICRSTGFLLLLLTASFTIRCLMHTNTPQPPSPRWLPITLTSLAPLSPRFAAQTQNKVMQNCPENQALVMFQKMKEKEGKKSCGGERCL